ncbi:MAG: hypothetical protein OEX07_02310, partial [Gammaproteobacteria bacterium]|nr:hypothetical protein [Gammaproteobacteria bacterium]
SSSNIRLGRIESQYRGQNLSSRPYLQGTIPLKGLVLSDSYTDTYTSMTCITVVQAIQYNNDLQGLLIADFNLDALPLQTNHSQFINHSRQFKGDPAIRGSLFNQQRVSSLLDTHIIKVHEVVEKLVTHYGAFHFKLHYSSSRISLWLYDQPHHYRLHNISDLLDETVFLYYPKRLYPEDACVDDTALSIVLSHFMALRFIDDNAYLRSASLNIINGMVGLNFSCDGSHYLPAEDFIENSLDYWQGSLAENKTINT